MPGENKDNKKKGGVIILYDKDSDILSVGKDGKVKFSIDLGEYVLDVSDKGFIIGADFLNFSKNFRIPKEEVSEIHKAAFNVRYFTDHILVIIRLYRKEREEALPIPISLNTNRECLLTA